METKTQKITVSSSQEERTGFFVSGISTHCVGPLATDTEETQHPMVFILADPEEEATKKYAEMMRVESFEDLETEEGVLIRGTR
jgi:hypothetical protein